MLTSRVGSGSESGSLPGIPPPVFPLHNCSLAGLSLYGSISVVKGIGGELLVFVRASSLFQLALTADSQGLAPPLVPVFTGATSPMLTKRVFQLRSELLSASRLPLITYYITIPNTTDRYTYLRSASADPTPYTHCTTYPRASKVLPTRRFAASVSSKPL